MKTPSVFAIAAVVVLVVGIAIANTSNSPRLLIPGRFSTIAYPAEVLNYFLAAAFCVIALIESCFTIPLSKTMVGWHCWLSIGSAVLFLFGMGLWCISMYRPPDLMQRFQLAIVVPLIVGIPVFILAQAWFCGDLVRALLKMRSS